MSSKKNFPKILIKLPWWFDLILATLLYYVFKYWLPTLYFKNADLNRFVHALPQFAEIFAGILVVYFILGGSAHKDTDRLTVIITARARVKYCFAFIWFSPYLREVLGSAFRVQS